ncbi:MAG: hypothetical protein NE328_11870 [Lentisphaeraceae bacterium]|nr:hypothetical protein [Lentisphaeraceae bacterium]
MKYAILNMVENFVVNIIKGDLGSLPELDEPLQYFEAKSWMSPGVNFNNDEGIVSQIIIIDIPKEKENKWESIKKLRSGLIESNIEHTGNIYQVDSTSRESMQDAVQEMSVDDRIDWRTAEKDQQTGIDKTVNLSAVQIGNILSKYRLRKMMLYQASWLAEVEIQESETPQDIDAEVLLNTKISEVLAAQ